MRGKDQPAFDPGILRDQGRDRFEIAPAHLKEKGKQMIGVGNALVKALIAATAVFEIWRTEERQELTGTDAGPSHRERTPSA